MDLSKQLNELNRQLLDSGVQFALIGGLAVNAHARPRATADIALLVGVSDRQNLQHALESLGYKRLDEREDIASYIRGSERVDAVFARRKHAVAFLDEATPIGGYVNLPVVSAEALVALKLQGFNNDPRRLQDLADIIAIVDHQGAALDVERLRQYFELFDQLPLFEELFSQ